MSCRGRGSARTRAVHTRVDSCRVWRGLRRQFAPARGVEDFTLEAEAFVHEQRATWEDGVAELLEPLQEERGVASVRRRVLWIVHP